jgi:hypothetical protein
MREPPTRRGETPNSPREDPILNLEATIFIEEIQRDIEELDKANEQAYKAFFAKLGWKGVDQSKLENRKAKTQWLLRRRHQFEPLIFRRWVPFVCIAALAIVWSPDAWKLRTLYYLDWKYALFRRWIHTEYWRLTMPPEEFTQLMEQIDANAPRRSRVKGTKCPL